MTKANILHHPMLTSDRVDGLTMFHTNIGWQVSVRARGQAGWSVHSAPTLAEAIDKALPPQRPAASGVFD